MNELLTAKQQLYFQILHDLHSCWTPHAKQIEALQPLIQGQVNTVFLQCGRKFGKMIDLETKIFTPDRGYIRFGDIKVNDQVFDEQGHVQQVTAVSETNLSPEAYLITFGNGEQIKACADHLWFTWTKADRKNQRRGLTCRPSVKNTRQIFDTLKVGREYNHSIPLASAVVLPEQDLLIDPYVLGVWLGDGNCTQGSITSVDLEIIEEIKKAGFEVQSGKSKQRFGILKLEQLLKTLGVHKNKHVPTSYLMSSIKQRLDLLQGLMDTDGTVNTRGNNCSFYNTNKDLADAVFHLVASLGMKPSMHNKVGRINGKPYKVCYTVSYRPLIAVFRLPRKLNRINFETPKRLHHTIINVERCEAVPMRCIAVTGNSHLYTVTNSHIPTHNTELAAYFLWRIGLLNPGSVLYFICQEANHGREIIWRNRRLQTFGPSKYVQKTLDNEMVVYFKNYSFIKIIGSENYAAADGLTPNASVYDEYKSFNPQFHIAMDPNRIVHKSPLLILGTPPQPYSPNYQQYIDYARECQEAPNKRWFNFSSYDNPHIDPKEIDAKKEEYIRNGEYDVFEREYLGRLVAGGKKAIFPMLTKEHVWPHEDVYAEIKRDLKKLDWYITVDPGSTTCSAVLFVAINPWSKKIYILDELYETLQINTSVGTIYPKILAIYNELHPAGNIDGDVVKTYDEAAAWFSTEVMDQFGVYFQQTQKEQNKKESGLSLIKDCLNFKSILISDRCKNLYREMNMYSLDETGRIPKKNDHLIDCLRYTLAAAFYTVKEVHEFVKVEEERRRGFTFEEDRKNSKYSDWPNNFDGELYDYY